MEPRFIIKTHTRSLRPGNFSILISKCTYPDRSLPSETVSKRLAEFLKILYKNNKETKLAQKEPTYRSVSANTLLVAQKRYFGFLQDNMIWSWKGHVINAVLSCLGKDKILEDSVKCFFDLNKMEEILYLRYFLETDGALILEIAKKINEKGQISHSQLAQNIQDIFDKIDGEYSDIAIDFREKIRIKQRFKERRKQMKGERYEPSTLPHKVKPIIEALEDMGILVIKKNKDEEFYESKTCNGISAIKSIVQELQNVQTMEKVFDEYQYFYVIGKIFNLTPTCYNQKSHNGLLWEALLDGYLRMKDKVYGLADIDALVDWCCIKMLSEDNVLVKKDNIVHFLDDMRRKDSSSIRYHVNGKGRIAYLILAKYHDGK